MVISDTTRNSPYDIDGNINALLGRAHRAIITKQQAKNECHKETSAKAMFCSLESYYRAGSERGNGYRKDVVVASSKASV